MNHTLSVTVHMDPDCGSAQLLATGCLTETSQQGLLSLVLRVCRLEPATPVTVDLTAVRHLEAAAFDLLRSSMELDDPLRLRAPARFLLPGLLPACPVDNAALETVGAGGQR